MDYGLNWKSLTQPAILPLTTDYVPPIKLMDRSYDVNNVYQLLVDKQESPFLTSEDLMQELICLRLTQVTILELKILIILQNACVLLKTRETTSVCELIST